MDFRRSTESNPDDNCEYYNKHRLRAFAKENKIPVIAFDATHENISQKEGLQLEDANFRALPKRFEGAVGAPVFVNPQPRRRQRTHERRTRKDRCDPLRKRQSSQP